MTQGKSGLEITEELAEEVEEGAHQVQATYGEFWTWMITKGKEPRREKSLSESTAENYFKRLDHIHRQIIRHIDPEDKTIIQADHADDFLFLIDRGDITTQDGDEYSDSSKRKLSNTLKKYFDWRYFDGSLEYQWQPSIQFTDDRNTKSYRFTYEELGNLLETAESYGSLPSYAQTSGDERDGIKALIAQRLGIPKDVVSRNDWMRADQSAKIHSLITVGYDGGLTPIEIGNAEVSWYDPQRQVLRIPTEKACKQREKEEIALADETAESLSRWIKERRHLEQYDGTSKLWLNREGNPYSSGNLCYLIRRLCEEAGIATERKEIRWYSLRYTMGTNMTDEGELSEANDQLRHSTIESTKNYDVTPVAKLQKRINATHEKATNAALNPEYNPFAEEEEGEVMQNSTGAAETDLTHQPSDGDDVVTRVDENTLHADGTFSDTADARVDIARKILSSDDEE